MSKKRSGSRLEIKNSLYRRFTNMNKGNTPRSSNTRYLTFCLDNRKRVYYIYSPYSVRCSRIYRIKHNGNRHSNNYDKQKGIYTDLKLDFCSFNSGSSLVSLANTLDASKVSGVYIEEDGGHIIISYLFPFVKGTSTQGSNKLYTETSSTFYPGVYYSRGCWYFTQSSSTSLTKIEGYFHPTSDSYSTDYTSSDFKTLSLNIPSSRDKLLASKYFIYIPFSSIQTPVLQAYLPLVNSVLILSNLTRLPDGDTVSYVDFTDDTPDHNEGQIRWMGKSFHNVHLINESRIVQELSENYAYSGDSSSLPTISWMRTVCNTYVSNDTTTGSSSPHGSPTYGDIRQYGFAVFKTLPQMSYFNDVIQDGSHPKIYVNIMVAPYRDVEDSNYNYKITIDQLATKLLNCSCDSYLTVGDTAYLYFYSEKVCTYADNYTRLIRYQFFFEISPYNNVKRDVTVTDTSIERNEKLNDILSKIIYFNTVPLNSGFAHLSRTSVF